MKLDKTIKLSDVLKIATAIVVATTFVVTDRMDIASLRRDRESDRGILADLSKGFAEITKWQAATEVRLSDVERDRVDYRGASRDVRHGGTIQALKDGGD